VTYSSSGNNANRPRRVFADTNSYCGEAALHTQKLLAFLRQIGLAQTLDIEQADFAFFYACGHLRWLEEDSIRIIKEINRLKKPSAKLIVWGCLPKINPRSIEALYKGPIVGPEDWDFFLNYFGQPAESLSKIYANSENVHCKIVDRSARASVTAMQEIFKIFNFFFYGQHKRADRGTWHIRVISGCRNSCTYCSDRLAYQRVKSVPVEDILEQFGVGLRSGYKHFILVGRDLGSYGSDGKLSLADLVNEINHRFGDQDFKLHLTHVSPNTLIALYPRIDVSLLSKKIFEIGSHIQSGSDRILKLMGKKFPLAAWLGIIKSINDSYPNIRTYTSIMVGFPGETNEDFRETLNMLQRVLFDRIDVYYYQERPNLPSLKLKGRVPEDIKKSRYNSARIHAIINNAKKRMKRLQLSY
jgi:tRNA A37 methylthiotransferase MiaB